MNLLLIVLVGVILGVGTISTIIILEKERILDEGEDEET